MATKSIDKTLKEVWNIVYKQRDILIIPIPFTDLTTNKKRPVVVLSNDSYNNKAD